MKHCKAVKSEGHIYLQWLVAILANTSTLSYGLQLGWMSPMTKVLQSELSPTGGPVADNQLSWIASSLSLGAVVGVFLYAHVADRFGRKVGVLAIPVPQMIGWMIKLLYPSVTAFIIARVLAGLSAAGCFAVVPIYVREISQDNIRGQLGSLLILSQNVGMLAMFILGAYLDYYTILWIVLWLPIVTFTLMMFAPESPAFLIKIGRFEEAERTVALLRGLDVSDKSVQDQINTTKNEDLAVKSMPAITLFGILRNKVWRRILFVMTLLLAVNSCNGSFAMMTYASTLLASSGATISPEFQALGVPAVMILASFLSMGCVERCGRKTILVVTITILLVTMLIIASVLLAQHQGSSVPSWLPVTSTVVSVGAYAGGLASVPYIVMSEIFNFQIRAKLRTPGSWDSFN